MRKLHSNSTSRSVKVKIVKAHQQIPYLQGENVIDTRVKTKRGFGHMFFVTIKKAPKTERDNWQKLEKSFKKRFKD